MFQLYLSCLGLALCGPAPPLTRDKAGRQDLAELDDKASEVPLINTTEFPDVPSTTSNTNTAEGITEKELSTNTTESQENAEVTTIKAMGTEIYPRMTTTQSAENAATEDILLTTTAKSTESGTDDTIGLTTEKKEITDDLVITSTMKSTETVTEDEVTEVTTENIFTTSTSRSVEMVTGAPVASFAPSQELDTGDVFPTTTVKVGAGDLTDITEEYLTGKERKALVSHLDSLDLESVGSLVLTSRQKTALLQEVEVRRLGLSPWSDLSAWQRLSREEQVRFNEKYLGLPSSLQQFSRTQFMSLPEERQEHAYRMFLVLDEDTLKDVIARELDKQREVEILSEDDETSTPAGIRITATQLKQLQEERTEEMRTDLPRQILQISTEQIKELGHQIDLIDNSIDDSNDGSEDRYDKDIHSAFIGANETLQKVEEKKVDKKDDQTIVEPTTTTHTTEPGIYEELEMISGSVAGGALYSDDDDDTVSTESGALYHENYLYDQPTGDDDPTQIPITTSVPSSVLQDRTTQTPPADQTEKTTDKSLTIVEEQASSHIKKVNNVSLRSKFDSLPTKKIVFRKKKNPEKSRISGRQREVVKTSNSNLKRKTISGDSRLAAWQARARSRHAYDPRRTRRVYREPSQHTTTRAQLLHFKIAEAQLAKAIQLQECLKNASACEV